MPRLQAAKPKQMGLCNCPRGFSRLCLPALLFWLLCTAAPGRDKPQRAPRPRTAPNNNSQHPGILSNAQAAATAPVCPDRQSRPLPGAALFCCRGSSVLLSLLHKVSVLSSDFCEYALLHPGLCFGTGEQPQDQAGAAPASTALCQSLSYLPAYAAFPRRQWKSSQESL